MTVMWVWDEDLLDEVGTRIPASEKTLLRMTSFERRSPQLVISEGKSTRVSTNKDEQTRRRTGNPPGKYTAPREGEAPTGSGTTVGRTTREGTTPSPGTVFDPRAVEIPIAR